MRAPHNTATNSALENLITAMGPRGIEAQEAQGQRSLITSDTLPTEGIDDLRSVPGMDILGPVDGDPLFTYVKLPEGWSKRETDHHMWSDLLDNKGRKRGAIFYKAAFYDRRARVNLNARFRIDGDYEMREQTGQVTASVVDSDGDKVVFRTAPRAIPAAPLEYGLRNEARHECLEWLAEHYPDHENTLAYWDAP